MSEYVNPVEQLIHSTVRIECESLQGKSSGTGYFYSFLNSGMGGVPCIVTNKHVINGATKGKFHLTIRDENAKPNLNSHLPIEFNNFENMWIKHPDPNIDLAIFPINPLVEQSKARGIEFYFILLSQENIANQELLDSLPSMEEIIMIGYPSGLWDERHNLPIIRKGITATHPKLPYNGKPEFMIDAACFPGSSGSPVFLANIGSFVDKSGALCAGTRIALLGTLYAGPQHTTTGEVRIVEVPTDMRPISISTIPINLGLVIQCSKLLDFDAILKPIIDFEIQMRNQQTPNP